jgi:hypothetical protein
VAPGWARRGYAGAIGKLVRNAEEVERIFRMDVDQRTAARAVTRSHRITVLEDGWRR